MRRYYNITHQEYLEYEQNGCIRAKDYEKPKKKYFKDKVYCESFDRPTILDVLDSVTCIRVNYGFMSAFVRKIESYSFGTLFLERMDSCYLLRVMNMRKIPRLMKRLELEGLSPILDEQHNQITFFAMNY